MHNTKRMMTEAATLYYRQKKTQQEIAEIMHLSRQTVSKLLGDAVAEGIVEITVHDAEEESAALGAALAKRFGIRRVIVCTSSGPDATLRRMHTVNAAIAYLTPLMKRGNQHIGISWGRTIEALIGALDRIETGGNTVFPLFGATDADRLCFSSNELARALADKIGSRVKNAWFPYLPDSAEERELFKHTACYQSVAALWDGIDVAIVGIGDTTVRELFQKTFGGKADGTVLGDMATHFFDAEGRFIPLYENSLCASVDNLRAAGETVAVACGDEKVDAIRAALKTGVVDVLITDEYTAKLL